MCRAGSSTPQIPPVSPHLRHRMASLFQLKRSHPVAQRRLGDFEYGPVSRSIKPNPDALRAIRHRDPIPENMSRRRIVAKLAIHDRVVQVRNAHSARDKKQHRKQHPERHEMRIRLRLATPHGRHHPNDRHQHAGDEETMDNGRKHTSPSYARRAGGPAENPRRVTTTPAPRVRR